MNGIKPEAIQEGNLAAVKCTSDFGGPNQWNLKIKTSMGYWEDVQWMNVYSIQKFFKTKLPVYKEQKKSVKYELANS
jgi:hypothetical protein